MLDDNHDGIGTFELLSMLTSEGDKSKDVVIGKDLITQEDTHSTTRFSVLPYTILNTETSTASFGLEIDESERFDQFWIDVKSDMTHNCSKTRKTTPKILIHPDISTSANAQWHNINKFREPGRYQVLYFAKERATDHVLLLREKIVYKNKKQTQ